jgi:predicted MFS family arabinose efflux permease
VDTLTGLFLTVPLLGLSGSIFWPAIEGAIGSETEPGHTEKAIGIFNVLWSVGKGTGFLMAGWMTGSLGPRHTLWAAAAAGLAIFLFYPWKDGRPAERGETRTVPGRSAFRTLGYVANFFIYGLGSTLQVQFFKYLRQENLGTSFVSRETFFGFFLGTIFIAQTVTFLAMQRGRWWVYRRSLLYLSQALLATTAGILTLARNDVLILALTPLVGLGLGFSYASSLYYSLHGANEQGKYSGIHEAVLGAGTIVFPFAGGILADATGDLRVPYWLAGGATLAAIALEEAIYRRRSRS